MKKLLLCLTGCLFIASILLNLYMGKVIFSSPSSGKNERSGKAKVKSSPIPAPEVEPSSEKQRSYLFHFEGAEYSRWSEKIMISFSHSAKVTKSSLLKKNTVKITPEVKIKSIDTSDGLACISGDFTPGKTYLFRLEKTLKTSDGGSLAFPAVFSVRIPDKYPAIKFLTQGPYLPAKQGKLTLPYSVVNVKNTHLEVRKYYENSPEDVFRYYYSSSSAEKNTYLVYEKDIKFSLPENEVKNRILDLTDLYKKCGPGIYRVSFVASGGSERSHSDESIKVILSDLGIISALPLNGENGEKGGVFIRSLSANLPVEGCELILYSAKKQIFARGVTDKEGKCVLTIRRSIKDNEDFAKFLVAKKGRDISFLPLDAPHDTSVFTASGRTVNRETEALVYTVRGICRPGEKLDGGLFIRKTAGGLNKAVSSLPVSVTVTDPAGNTLPAQNITVNKEGFSPISFTIPADARTGSWKITVNIPGTDPAENTLGSTRFLVGEYVPDRIKADLNTKKASSVVSGNESITFLPDAAYYFGAKLEKHTRGTLTVSSSLLNTMPAHWKGFAAGDASSWKKSKLFSKMFTLENKEIRYPGFTALEGESFSPVMLTAVFSVAEPGGRSVSKTLRIACNVRPYYIGVKEEPRSIGNKLLVDWKLFAFDKKTKIPAEKRSYTVTLARKEWNYLLKESDNRYSYEWVCKEIPVLEKDVVSASLSGVLDLDEQQSGEYILTITDKNNIKTRHTFWFNAGDAGKRSGNPSILSLNTDKRKYLPGETVRLTLSSPGKGAVLVASGKKETFTVKTFAVKEGKNTLSIKIPENADSSVFPAGVTLLTDRNSQTKRAFALTLIPVDLSASRKLDVLLSFPEKARPNEKITLEAKLRTKNGLPAEGSVHIFGCDAGILSLTNWKTPDIYDFFSGKRLSRYSYCDIYSKLFPLLTLQSNGKFGGDSIGYAARKEMFPNTKLKTSRPAVFSLGTVKTGKDGKGKASIQLPDFTGSMVISAVAADQIRTGSFSADMLIRDRIGITASLPGTASPGDVIEGSFTLFNFDAENGEYSFSLTLPSEQKKAVKKHLSGKLVKGGQATCRIQLTAPAKNGNHTLAYHLVLKTAEGSYSKKGNISFAVRPRSPMTKESTLALLEAGKTLTVKGDKAKWYSAPFACQITVDSNPLSVIADALDYLSSYPYGCLEQTAAAAFPLLSADFLAKCNIIEKDRAATSKRIAAQAAYRILSMLRYDGSFSMWPGGNSEYRTGTLFASHYLFEAENHTAFELPHAARYRITGHLYRIAENAALSRGERAYAAYILALANSRKFLVPAKNLLLEEKKDLASLFAAMALVKGGYAAEGAYYIKELFNGEVWREKDVPYRYADNNVRAGMLLYILSGIQQKDPRCIKLFTMLQNSLRKDSSGWGTTQANAWAILGITAYAAANDMVNTAKKGFCGKILKDGGKTLSVPAGGKVTLSIKDGEKVKIVNTSSAPLFIRTLTSGILKNAGHQSKGMSIKREYLDEKGNLISSAAHGDLVTVKITVETKGYLSDAVICDLLPGGLEIEDGSLASRAGKVQQQKDAPFVKFRENRADRLLLFCNLTGKQTYIYKARAVIRGKYAVGAISAEGMYDPDTMARYAPAGVFEIK